MKNRKKQLRIILGVITLALAGLAGLQIVLLNNAWKLRRQAFEKNINAALVGVVQELERLEALEHTIGVAFKFHAENDSVGVISKSSGRRYVFADSLKLRTTKTPENSSFAVDNGKLFYDLADSQHVKIQITSIDGEKLADVVNGDHPAGKYEVEIDSTLLERGSLLIRMATENSFSTYHYTSKQRGFWQHQPASDDEKRGLVTKILADLDPLQRKPIEERINQVQLDSLIQTRLAENDIFLPHAFGIFSEKNDSLRMTNRADMIPELRDTPFRERLFPFEPFGARHDLALHFPDENMFVLQKMGALFFATIVLVSIIVLSFVYTVRTIFRQQRFATSVMDFVNNMTHEFKTPISTISLATEALENPAALENKEKVLRYNGIVRDENLRMREQVEKILQMAVLENKEYELKISQIDVHALLKNAVQKITLQIEKRGGKIIENLQATSSHIKADAVHLASIIFNLLDNASKYTKRSPVIEIATANAENGVQIRVRDNGIGLHPEDQKQVFDKYFRVSTGNIHDVKGFGLGLSYVKLIVEAHGGNISVQSELDKGSQFDVFLPFEPTQNKSDISNEQN